MATTAVHNGRVAISTTGTAVAFGSNQEVDWVCVSAPFMNKGAIFIGDSNVTGAGSTPAATDGYLLMPGKEVRLGSCDLDEIFIEGRIGDCIYWVAGSGYSLPV